MRRRTFLTLVGSAGLSQSLQFAPADADSNPDIAKDPNYRLSQHIETVDEIFVERQPGPHAQWVLRFTDWGTTPEGDREVILLCPQRDPGFHVEGEVRHETSLWAPSNATTFLMITFESTADVRIFRHTDRGKDVVVNARRRDR